MSRAQGCAGATQLKTPYRDGTTHVIFEPLEFMAHFPVRHPSGDLRSCKSAVLPICHRPAEGFGAFMPFGCKPRVNLTRLCRSLHSSGSLISNKYFLLSSRIKYLPVPLYALQEVGIGDSRL